MSGDILGGTGTSTSGIGILARNSLTYSSRRQSQMSLLTDTNSVDYSLQVDDRNWSWSYLRSNFRINELSSLYERYVQRLQNAYFVVFLLLQMSISLAIICILLLYNQSNLEVTYPEVTVHGIIAVFCVLGFFLTNDEKLFRSKSWAQVVVSVLATVIIVGADIGLSAYFSVLRDRKRTPIAFQTLIIIYFFLPLPRKYQAIVLGTLVSIIHLLFAGLFLYNGNEDKKTMIVADMVYYLCGNVVGLYSQLVSEITIRRAFLDRRGYIKSTIKKKYEKAQEEQLLLSILPSHIATKVKDELLLAITTLKQDHLIKKHSANGLHNFEPLTHHHHHHHHPHLFHGHHHHHGKRPKTLMQKKPFSNLFVEKHDNVTILFADIVNFTPLTEKLPADELVETLNELFGRFDEAAAAYNCLRIKLLGDCYYCVSGIPNPTPSHANNCVKLGFEMIDIIKDVREKLKVDVHMRIGIHSGKILSGLLGIYKWQYDIWSKDVTIANHMEQTGAAGSVHITEQTKKILGDAYEYEPCDAKTKDAYLAENVTETYLITPAQEIVNPAPAEGATASTTEEESSSSGGRPIYASGSASAIIRRQTSHQDARVRKSLRAARTGVGAGEVDIWNFRRIMSQVNEKMSKAIDDMPLRKTDQWCGRKRGSITLNETPLLMTFSSLDNEIQFQKQGDPLFKYYIGCALFVLVCIGIVQGLIMPDDHVVLWIAFGTGFTFLVSVFPFVWVGYIWSRLKDPHRELDRIPEPKSPLVRFFYKSSITVTNSLLIRTLIYLIVSFLISTFAIIDVVECDADKERIQEDAGGGTEADCESPWYFTYSCALAFLLVNGFFRINYLLKLLVCVISLAMYSLTIFKFRKNVFDSDFGAGPALPPVYSHVIYLVKIVLYLHFMDRQMEYINRLDFIWKQKLTEEHKEAQLTHEINTILIQNILPLQIAKIYMDPNRSNEGHNRSYENVAVMFASIPTFTDFYAENDLNNHGIRCLQLLNEIIVEFDQALVDFEEVEKIKVIGSTYMAACGLEVRDPGRTSNASVSSDYMPPQYFSQNHSVDAKDDNKRRKNLLTLVRFAASMMTRLQGVNKDAFQEFQLRVGICCGPVVAGVIGAQKPLYDIWGDTVNMASRMDSSGEPGRIQVAEDNAKLLMDIGVRCIPRGPKKIKGKKEEVNCFFVDLSNRYQIQYDKNVSSQNLPLPVRSDNTRL